VTLRLTPDLLAAAYDFLRTTEPFKAWRLPESDDVGFHVVSDPKMYADFGVENGVPIIRVSQARHGHTGTLMATMAHEAIHLYQAMQKLDRGGDHNADFKKRAKRVCAVHGWDPATF